MCWWRYVPLLLCLGSLCVAEEEQGARRVHSHLVIGDVEGAMLESELQLSQFPDSKVIQEAHIEVLGAAGDEKGMVAAFENYCRAHPEESTNRQVLEKMGWSVIEKGSLSTSPIIRLMTILAGFFAQDARGVVIVDKGLHDHNLLVRKGAIQLSSKLRDTRVSDSVLDILQNESVWNLRLEAIKAVGAMQIHNAKPILEKVLVDGKSTHEEQAAAIASLVNLCDSVEQSDLIALVGSPRAALRLLACQIATHLQLDESALILPLFKDPNAKVRAAAIRTVGKMGNYEEAPVREALSDKDPYVAISAAFLLTELGERHLLDWIDHSDRDVRLVAASALASSGRKGLELMLEAFQASDDPFVRMNLALGLLGQRVAVKESCDALYEGLREDTKRWMWRDDEGFHTLAPSTVKHSDTIPNRPEGVNQLTRLEVLNVLSIMEYPAAQSALKDYLSQKSWGVSGMASALMLTEGDEEAIELVKTLINESEEKIQLQAALILAMWGRDPEAIDVLERAYATADRDTKEHILEGLARIGAKSSIPFLVKRLKEPSQTLRIIAAAALLQSLYR